MRQRLALPDQLSAFGPHDKPCGSNADKKSVCSLTVVQFRPDMSF